MIPTLVIDSTNCLTELCFIGGSCYTDKSPLNPMGHRHPYTPIYSLLLSRFRCSDIRFAEIGIAGGSSVVMWNHFLEKGTFFFYDRDQNFLDNAKQFVPTQNNTFGIMDVRSPESIKECLESACVDGKLDILLDDSSHNPNDQYHIIHQGLSFIKSGGMIIIEDVSRDEPEESYIKILKDIYDEFSFVSFVLTEHKNKFCGEWNNDKLLVLIKK